jgi:enoyl-CoA hydratase
VTDVLTVTDPVPGVRLVQLNRPASLNALSSELIESLHRAIDDIAADPDCRVVVLTGAGRGFCAGVDLAEFTFDGEYEGWSSPQTRMRIQQRIATLVPKLRALRQPVIAAVNGPAAGGGLALALAADLRIAATSARFNVAFVRIGLSGCDIGVSWLLPRLIGASRAFELMLTGRLIDAGEADSLGLVTQVVPDDELLDKALATAELIARNSPMGVWMTKEVMWSQLEIGSLTAGIDLENRTQVALTYTADQVEAATAFRERRPPIFRNR